MVEDGAGNSSNLPNEEPPATLGIAPCSLASDLVIVDRTLSHQNATKGQIVGSKPTTVTIGLALENSGNSRRPGPRYATQWVSYRVRTRRPARQPSSRWPLPARRRSTGAPLTTWSVSTCSKVTRSTRKGGRLPGAAEVCQGQRGHRRRFAPGEGGPVSITGDIMANPTATATGPAIILRLATATPKGPVVVIPLPTATQLGIAPKPMAASGLVQIPADVIQGSGNTITVDHGEASDLDSGQIVRSNSPSADLILADGDDPYLDVIDPENGAFLGWAGCWRSSRSVCDIFKTSRPMAPSRPDLKETYSCFDTRSGRTAWVQLDTYVSQPSSERRMIFEFTTNE